MSANNRQVGGNHYAEGGEVQHWDLIARNFGPSYLIGCATKYVARWRKKHGRQDLEKALHYIEKLQELATEGVLRPSDLPAPAAVSPQDFARMNKLGEAEAQVVLLLCTWRHPDDLQLVWEIVDGLIKEA